MQRAREEEGKEKRAENENNCRKREERKMKEVNRAREKK